jgi:TP53 regulating kinase-like protein
MTDASAGTLGIEWIDGKTVKSVLPGGAIEDDVAEKLVSESGKDIDPLNDFGITSGTYNMPPLSISYQTFTRYTSAPHRN